MEKSGRVWFQGRGCLYVDVAIQITVGGDRQYRVSETERYTRTRALSSPLRLAEQSASLHSCLQGVIKANLKLQQYYYETEPAVWICRLTHELFKRRLEWHRGTVENHICQHRVSTTGEEAGEDALQGDTQSL